MADIPFLNITCVNRRAYGYTKSSSTYRLPALKGRPRYRLRDSWASYIVSVEWEFTDDQYEEFQRFWYDDLDAGVKFFTIRLMLDERDFYNSGVEVYVAHAMSGFQSTYDTDRIWTVRMEIEIAGGFRAGLIDCDIIIGDLSSPDVIYAGTPDVLPPDDIAPCEGIV